MPSLRNRNTERAPITEMQCQRCGKWLRARKDGSVRRHLAYDSGWLMECWGSLRGPSKVRVLG